MEFARPALLLLIIPAIALVWWVSRQSVHPMGPLRARWLLAIRMLLVTLALIGLAGPAMPLRTAEQAVIFVLDHSRSQGEPGIARTMATCNRLAAQLPPDTWIGVVSAGAHTEVMRLPERNWKTLEADPTLMERDGNHTNLADAIELARGLFPPGTGRKLVLLSDGAETRGDVAAAAREAAVAGVVIDAIPIAGEERPDIRVLRLRTSRARSHEGATVDIHADIESSLEGSGTVHLFENGIEVAVEKLDISTGEERRITFTRAPDQRNLYKYQIRLNGFANDSIPENNTGMALLEVRGRPQLLYIEGEPDEKGYLINAMAREGLRLVNRPPEAIPDSLEELAGYDGIILSDVPAYQLTDRTMALIRDYVELLGGGFMMIGGTKSFGVGGYYRTPIEEILPIKMQAPDHEERMSTALALVIDRSGSMSGQKIQLCKAAAIATADLLQPKDYIGVVAFDSNAHWVVPMTSAGSPTIGAQISQIGSGGGTNIYPGMEQARQGLASIQAKVKHMIVLTDGQTSGSGYQQLAAAIRNDGVTISTVAVGGSADTQLLQMIAAAGGGQFYETIDPQSIPRIFTQDTMRHTGRLIRESTFHARQVERHPMLEGWPVDGAPELLGYVKTMRRSLAQVPLVTDLDEPLLAHWRYGLGKVTAFTSDCKSRWSALWIAGWSGYSQFWAQVLREMAREPQGQHMDIHLEDGPQHAEVTVDLLADAATFRNEADVEASIFHVPANALDAAMERIGGITLDQVGPGRYHAEFEPDEPGLYLVRARSGAEMVAAGLVHDVSGEAATGRVDESKLTQVASSTGGRVLEPSVTEITSNTESIARRVELLPWILRALLILFIVDLGLRRWENVLGVFSAFSRKAN